MMDKISMLNFEATKDIFQINNEANLLDEKIDLHGLHLKQAKDIVTQCLRDTQRKLNKRILKGNENEGRDHVFKIICGAGNNSKNNQPVLKPNIYKMLVS